MKYIELKQEFKDEPLICLSELRKLEPNFDLRRISEWTSKGYLKQLARAYYVFADSKIDDTGLFVFANRLYAHSYISFESALSFYGVIPEAVYQITSVSSKKTSTFKTQFGDFVYRKLKPELLFGFKLEKNNFGYTYKIAELEKAILDYFYLNSQISTFESFKECRFNLPIIKARLNKEKFINYLKIFNNKQLSKRIKLLLESIESDQL